jgi:hypothetical protein
MNEGDAAIAIPHLIRQEGFRRIECVRAAPSGASIATASNPARWSVGARRTHRRRSAADRTSVGQGCRFLTGGADPDRSNRQSARLGRRGILRSRHHETAPRRPRGATHRRGSAGVLPQRLASGRGPSTALWILRRSSPCPSPDSRSFCARSPALAAVARADVLVVAPSGGQYTQIQSAVTAASRGRRRARAHRRLTCRSPSPRKSSDR